MTERSTASPAFGPNAWLVDDMYEQYLADPSSVSESWRDFFADYRRPVDGAGEPASAPTGVVLKGAQARIAANMAASLEVPTATSARVVPAKLLEVNRRILNNHLGRTRGGKVSFTHLIGYAVVEALARVPAMNSSFAEVHGKPGVVHHEHVGLGLAVDVDKGDGS